MDWSKKTYNDQYEKWVPWLEDVYLRWFTKDNKASYTTKDTLDKSKITGNEQIDTLQDGVNNLVAGQVGQGGLLQPAGDAASKDVFTRSERGGKDDDGSYAPSGSAGSGAAGGGAGDALGGVLSTAGSAVGKTGEAVKGAPGSIGSLLTGSEEGKQKK